MPRNKHPSFVSLVICELDGGIKPMRPVELGANEAFGASVVLLESTKGNMLCDVYGSNPRLLPLSRNAKDHTKRKIPLVLGEVDGHYWQWAEAAIAGYGKIPLSLTLEIAGPLIETLLIAIRGFQSVFIRWLFVLKDNDGK